jgi:hypothetical protein
MVLLVPQTSLSILMELLKQKWLLQLLVTLYFLHMWEQPMGVYVKT